MCLDALSPALPLAGLDELHLVRCLGLCDLCTQLVDRLLHLASILLPLRAEALVEGRGASRARASAGLG